MATISDTNEGDSIEIAPEGHRIFGTRTRTGYSTLGNGQSGAWKERSLLSLDGGGIRGYWTLLVLKELMNSIGDEERKQGAQLSQTRFDSFFPEDLPKYVSHFRDEQSKHDDIKKLDSQRFLPCHYFDYICGSSTGSLIAIMLSRFRMTVRDCLDEYERMSNTIFGKPRWISQRNIGIVRWPKYSAKAMERAFTDVTRRRGEEPARDQHAHNAPLFPTLPGTCAMFATTIRRTEGLRGGSARGLYLLRSYIHLQPQDDTPYTKTKINFGTAEQMEIWQVARAATAAPMYFSEIKFSPNDSQRRIYFSDGGFGHTNNPTMLGIQEIETLCGRDSVGAIVSIGTARADDKPGGRSILKRIGDSFSTATDPQTVATFVNYQERPNCWRLNDEIGLDIELDEWKPNGLTRNPGHKTLEKIKNGFNEWVLQRENRTMIKECARELVKRRRERTEDKDRWYRFATGASMFHCRHPDCHQGIASRQLFELHWQENHNDDEQGNKYKVPDFAAWEYRKKS